MQHITSMSQPLPNFIERLTLIGRLLFASAFIWFAVGFYFLFFYMADNFPAGRYPIMFILVPLLLGCFFYFFIGAWILERLGVRIYRISIDREDS